MPNVHLPSSNAPGQFNVDTREHLVYLLTEASEVEHNLMCCYLYAAFSLKTDDDEGLDAEELAAVRRWQRAIISVAVEEMVHLALVANLMSSIGAAPHFGRPNFPVASGYHPSGIVVKLASLTRAALDHFIYLERPEGASVNDGAGFEASIAYERISPAGRLMPSAQDYATVGLLYEGIRGGLRALVARNGGKGTFVGNPAQQLGPEQATLPGLQRITDLASALSAIDTIVTQGEGSPGTSVDSHFNRFVAVRDEWQRLQARNPAFAPARPAATNPVMRKPPVPEGRVWVNAERSAPLMDLANACYNQMLRLLIQAYAETRWAALRQAQVDAGIDLMFAMSAMGRQLTRLPATNDQPGCHAGMSFATLRGFSPLPAGAAADAFLLERLDEIAGKARELVLDGDSADALAASASRLRDACMSAEPAAPPASPTPVSAAATAPAAITGDGIESARGRHLTLRFEERRCIHARHCVLGLPDVFKANVQGAWLDPDASSAEQLAAVAHACPSGAITYVRHDGIADELAPAVNTLRTRENGPLALHAELQLAGQSIGYRATLCRCGASKNKPFCDGSHQQIGFTATGEAATRASEPLGVRGGVLKLRPQRNGPLAVEGPLEICSGTGRTIHRVQRTVLCRCGASQDKPFCDGSHARVGFDAP
jgi:CDGSH-type Zn-finger protein/uncharacterized Fe-S cluster protein YjdI